MIIYLVLIIYLFDFSFILVAIFNQKKNNDVRHANCSNVGDSVRVRDEMKF